MKLGLVGHRGACPRMKFYFWRVFARTKWSTVLSIGLSVGPLRDSALSSRHTLGSGTTVAVGRRQGDDLIKKRGATHLIFYIVRLTSTQRHDRRSASGGDSHDLIERNFSSRGLRAAVLLSMVNGSHTSVPGTSSPKYCTPKSEELVATSIQMSWITLRVTDVDQAPIGRASTTVLTSLQRSCRRLTSKFLVPVRRTRSLSIVRIVVLFRLWLSTGCCRTAVAVRSKDWCARQFTGEPTLA